MSREYFAPSVIIDADGDDHSGRDDTTILADFEVGRVDPDIGPVALERAVEKGLNSVCGRS